MANNIYKKILQKKQPEISSPVRSLSNVKFDPKKGYFELLGKEKTRTLTAATVKTFAQTLRMMGFSKNLVETDDIATKRETYYASDRYNIIII